MDQQLALKQRFKCSCPFVPKDVYACEYCPFVHSAVIRYLGIHTCHTHTLLLPIAWKVLVGGNGPPKYWLYLDCNCSGVVWCGVVWSLVWCGVVWCGVVWCGGCGVVSVVFDLYDGVV